MHFAKYDKFQNEILQSWSFLQYRFLHVLHKYDEYNIVQCKTYLKNNVKFNWIIFVTKHAKVSWTQYSVRKGLMT